MRFKDSKLFSVFFISVFFCGGIALWGVLSPQQMTGTALSVTRFLLRNLDWFFLLLCGAMLVLCGYLAFGPYAHIKLGKDDEKPEFSLPSWLSMLFAAGMGCGLLFWGVAEPIFHFMEPPGMEGGTPDAARMAMLITNFHWGLHAWAIYAVSALVLAYFGFRKGRPYLPSSPVRAAFSGKYVDFWCRVTDVVAVLSVVFGVAGSLAMGVMQIRAGLESAFHFASSSVYLGMGILVLVTVCYLLSASTGIDKGIKILSNINMITACVLLLFIIFAGCPRFVLETAVNTLGDYASRLVSMSLRLHSYQGMQEWGVNWTLTYFIWWIAWGPFVGIFIARISRGRTIRQFVIGVVLLPTLFSILWFSAFGGTGLYIELFGGGGLGELVREDVTTALFAFFDYFPMPLLLSLTALFLIFIFLVTSADSATFVVGMMTTEGELNPPTSRKLLWGIIISLLSGATLISKGVDVPKAIAISGAIPFSIILMLQIVAFLRVIREELPVNTGSGKEDGR